MKTATDKRLELQKILEDLLDAKHVYFQPPANIQMSYPAIVYSINDVDVRYANNKAYGTTLAYKVTVLDEDPDSELVQKILELPMCSFDTHYSTSNLNHYVFTLYY